MLEPIDPLTFVQRYHGAMPLRIREYLNHRGIIDDAIDLHLLGWNGVRITIPIFDRDGRLAFFKLAKDPDDRGSGPKMLVPIGSSAELYGWERLRAKPPRIVICEGEFDRLVLESRGIAAVTSTGGAGVFRREWAEAFRDVPEVFLCFDQDDAGRRGALRVVRILSQARLVELPEEVGPDGDVTDFFVHLGKTREDFMRLLEEARPAPVEAIPTEPRRSTPRANAGDRNEIETLKSRVRIEDVIGQYVPLAQSGTHLRGRCPFHEDQLPSLVVYPGSQTFHCFGCEGHGDVLTFLMQVEKVTFPEALQRLRSWVNRTDEGAA